MRHQKKTHKMGRKAPHRKKTLMALSQALIEHKRIVTTVSKAKALRPYVAPIITRAKEDNQHNRRQAFRHLQDNEAVTELFEEIGDKVADRNGGYTRVIRLGRRQGDGAEMAMIELVDYNDVQPETGQGGRRKRTRRGSGGGERSIKAAKRGDEDTSDAAAEETPAEDEE
jgi:large subunit ribosomal protein L17